MAARIYELIAQCPGCLTMETLEFVGNKLIDTARFKQKERGQIYHDCGSNLPCKLFPRFEKEWPAEKLLRGNYSGKRR